MVPANSDGGKSLKAMLQQQQVRTNSRGEAYV
ncbi:MAG: hypothetical protein JWP50_1033, partial [Phenylobacterium sp.]|nr:hypothetical protein [Phenylobacterium sp.]